MTETFTLLVAGRDDDLRDELIGQLLADTYQANPVRTMAETRCRAATARTCCCSGNSTSPPRRCR
jgi:ferric iron reductase protein FhuF